MPVRYHPPGIFTPHNLHAAEAHRRRRSLFASARSVRSSRRVATRRNATAWPGALEPMRARTARNLRGAHRRTFSPDCRRVTPPVGHQRVVQFVAGFLSPRAFRRRSCPAAVTPKAPHGLAGHRAAVAGGRVSGSAALSLQRARWTSRAVQCQGCIPARGHSARAASRPGRGEQQAPPPVRFGGGRVTRVEFRSRRILRRENAGRVAAWWAFRKAVKSFSAGEFAAPCR